MQETKLITKLDELRRDVNRVVNMDKDIVDLQTTLKTLNNEIQLRPTLDDIQEQMARLNGYVTLRQFDQLSGIVKNKCEWITVDELRLRVEGTESQVKDHDIDIHKIQQKNETQQDDIDLINRTLEQQKSMTTGKFKDLKEGLNQNRDAVNRAIKTLREDFDRQAEENTKLMVNLVSRSDFEKIYARFADYASFADFEKFS